MIAAFKFWVALESQEFAGACIIYVILFSFL